MDTIIEIVGKLLAVVVVAVVTWLAPKVSKWLTAKIGEANTNRIKSLVSSFARAADQLLKADDPTGEKRNAYVVEQLELLGIEVTETVISLIEGAVFDVNNAGTGGDSAGPGVGGGNNISANIDRVSMT